ncbi:hypothetical protein SAY86_023091 [Trapa natans]|uniref:ACT domain-containing protein ACR n=1 Tax=Trapa natans TaxID=22666 RepID=A0AAN7LTY9_TRANT|nr:hypothetical protein SAY86_023091 [Trapa natans]
MECQSWSSYLEEYQKLVFRLDTPRVVIDNGGCPGATVITVDSARKHGILLEAVQILTDLNLSIKKAYISSDGRWFMDVFHVTDQNGMKLTDKSVISYIEQVKMNSTKFNPVLSWLICPIIFLRVLFFTTLQSLGTIQNRRTNDYAGMMALELTGTDRVGLLSEVFAVLSHMDCNVVEAKAWTHNGRMAAMVYVKSSSGLPIEDSQQIYSIETLLRSVLKGDSCVKSYRTPTVAVTHTERRLHQMMFADRDYDYDYERKRSAVSVTVQNWVERGYSVVNVQCRDRNKLLFDVVCTLTDMQYIVFHAIIDTNSSDNMAYLEFCIRHIDGTPINSEAEKERVIQCLEAAVERRASDGLRLELCAEDRQGLLADVTRTFRENGLNVTRAEVSTTMGTAYNVFHVTDTVGDPADPVIMEAVRERMGLSELQVKQVPLGHDQKGGREEDTGAGAGIAGAMLLSIGSMVRRNLYSLGLIR